MKEIIFRTEKGSYRWRPTRWMKAMYYAGLSALFIMGGYSWMLLIYSWKIGA